MERTTFEFYNNGTVWKLVQDQFGATKFYDQVGYHGFSIKELGKEIEYEYGSPHVKFDADECPAFEPE